MEVGKFTANQLKKIVIEMNRLQEEHPKANIYFDANYKEIRITYPLPKLLFNQQ